MSLSRQILSETVLFHQDHYSYVPVQGKTWIRQCVVLFRDPVLLLVLFANFLCWTGIYVRFLHFPERARLLGMDMETVGWIASIMSLSNIIGRPTLGSLPSFFKIDAFYLYGLVNGLAGLITILCPFLATKGGMIAYAALFGILNVCVPLVRASLASLSGPNIYPLAYSWVTFCEGVALLIGPAAAGFLYDFSSSYDYSFYAAGSVLVASGILTLLQRATQRMKERRYEISTNVA